jgi:tight adherence protein B
MTGIVVALLLAASCVLLALRGAAPPVRDAGAATGRPPGSRPQSIGHRHGGVRIEGVGRAVDLHELPLFVLQLAGLLRAGRPPHVLWADMERVHAGSRSAFATVALPVLATARRAAELGLSVPEALRQATARSGASAAGGPDHEHLDRLWVDLSGCLIVAERSGAPLARILEQYAAQLVADLDGLSAREAALAGPRATVVLLAWLPAVGLVLGFALGLNPLAVLLGSFLGRAALAAGVVLMIASRVWTRRLVRRASAAGSGP